MFYQCSIHITENNTMAFKEHYYKQFLFYYLRDATLINKVCIILRMLQKLHKINLIKVNQ